MNKESENNPFEENQAEELKKEAKSVTISDTHYEELQKGIEEHRDKYLRLLAESENFRKRMQKEREELTRFAVQNVIAEFLGPLDHMDNALSFTEQASAEVSNWAVGFKMIHQQFKDVLDNHGVERIATEGKPFDPHFHEAVETEENSHLKEGTIIKELSRGYKMGNRTIRPARVIVSKKPAQKGKAFHEDPSAEEQQKSNKD